MSRCFPYPPPGYDLIRAKIEAMAESIKEKERKREKSRQKKEKRKEREGSKEHKEKREEKEQKIEKRKERKEQKKDKTNQNSETLTGHVGQESYLHIKDECFHKKGETKTQQLEGSSLTEEHSNPVNLHAPSSSSESTENSHKRKKDTSRTNSNHGKVILIRLPSKNQNEFDALAKEQQQQQQQQQQQLVSASEDFTTLRTNRGHICSTSGQIEDVASRKTGTKLNDAVTTSMQRMELVYKNLLEDLFPPRPEDACPYTDNLDWLKNDETRTEKRRRLTSDDITCSRNSSSWPRAEYLHEVDVYALPYTVPF